MKTYAEIGGVSHRRFLAFGEKLDSVAKIITPVPTRAKVNINNKRFYFVKDVPCLWVVGTPAYLLKRAV